MALANTEVLQLLENQFGDKILSAEEAYGMLSITITPDCNLEVLTWLYAHPTLKMQFLTDITGIHFPHNKGNEFGVIYHIHSFSHNFRLRLKAFVPAEKPEIATVTPLYSGANWMERETFDFFGIHFEGHPNLIRILNVEDMDYHPLRKEYPLEDATRTDKNDTYFGR